MFVADNIKEVIPEYLLMLKGVLDCPELPLNVSRSYLQNNTYVSKVSAHIVKKVADKLCSLCNTAREEYEKVWSDIRTFVEYACMRDRKFWDRVKDALLLNLTDGKTVTVPEYLEAAKEKHANTVYYTTDRAAQAQYIKLFEAEGLQVAVLDKQLDTQFVSMIETYDTDVKYRRIDADVAASLKGEGESAEDPALVELFRKAAGDDKLKVEFAALRDGNVPVLLTLSEESRRMDDMMRLYGMAGGMPADNTLTVNTASPLIAKLKAMEGDRQATAAAYLYRLALLSQRKLTADELNTFLSESYGILGML